MSLMLSAAALASGVVLAARTNCTVSRASGAGLIAACLAMTPSAALADENILAVDNGEVHCNASEKDLTRIALKDDQFVAVSSVQTGNPTNDFSIVHEPTRGDIYISVPEGFSKANLSFFGTTQKGFVYKFNCKVGGSDAMQVFVANADVENPKPAAQAIPASASLDDHAAGLVLAMFEQRPIQGYEIKDVARAPVNVGDLKVQLMSEYRSPTMTGKIMRIQNTGDEAIELNEELIAGDGPIAVSISNRKLSKGQATTAHIVVQSGAQ